jgi:hypothetical protein
MIACDWGVHVDSLHEWAKAHPEFSEAKKLAKQYQEAFMQKLGMAGMTGNLPKGRSLNPSMWIFWMKARHRWDEAGPGFDDEEIEPIFD